NLSTPCLPFNDGAKDKSCGCNEGIRNDLSTQLLLPGLQCFSQLEWEAAEGVQSKRIGEQSAHVYLDRADEEDEECSSINTDSAFGSVESECSDEGSWMIDRPNLSCFQAQTLGGHQNYWEKDWRE
ncbi:unnamed protein product, partial [Choristocarpus tenellus]